MSEIALSINIWLIQIHKYSSAELLLRYKLRLTHFNTHSLKLSIWTDKMKAKVNKAHNLYLAIREKKWRAATDNLATHQGKSEAIRTTTQELSEAENLVLVRDTQLNN